MFISTVYKNKLFNGNLIKKNLSNKFIETLFTLLIFIILTYPAYEALLRPGMITGHDIEGHMIRLMEFDQALKDGHFPVRWSKNLNFGLGYPFFNFNYPLPYYLSEFIHILGFDYVQSIKNLMLITFPLSGFFSFLWLSKNFGKLPGFLGGIFYTIIPYHFLNVYVRGAVAEAVALMFLPLCFLAVDLLVEKQSIKRLGFLSFCLSLLILSHNISMLIYFPIIFLYGLCKMLVIKRIKDFIWITISFFWGIGLSAFFLLPMLYYKSIIPIDFLIRRYYFKNFPEFNTLIYSPWGYGGAKVGVEKGEMSFQIGLLHIAVTLLAFVLVITLVFQKKKSLQLYVAVLFTIVMLLTIFLLQPISLPVWNVIFILQYMEFPWRLSSVLGLSVSVLTAFTVFILNQYRFLKNIILVICLILIVGVFYLNRNHWRANEYYTWVNYWSGAGGYNSTTTWAGEHLPKWSSSDEWTLPYLPFKVLEGSATAQLLNRKTNLHEYRVNVSSTSAIVADRTVYFPGWKVFVDNKEIETLEPYKTKGLIAFKLPEGEHLARIVLKETNLEKISNGISFISLFLLFFTIIFSRRINLKLRKVKQHAKKN